MVKILKFGWAHKQNQGGRDVRFKSESKRVCFKLVGGREVRFVFVKILKNLRELSQPQERFVPKFRRNQGKIFF